MSCTHSQGHISIFFQIDSVTEESSEKAVVIYLCCSKTLDVCPWHGL